MGIFREHNIKAADNTQAIADKSNDIERATKENSNALASSSASASTAAGMFNVAHNADVIGKANASARVSEKLSSHNLMHGMLNGELFDVMMRRYIDMALRLLEEHKGLSLELEGCIEDFGMIRDPINMNFIIRLVDLHRHRGEPDFKRIALMLNRADFESRYTGFDAANNIPTDLPTDWLIATRLGVKIYQGCKALGR